MSDFGGNLSIDERKLIDVLRSAGGSASNQAAQKTLEMETTAFFIVRNNLIDKGWVAKKQGCPGRHDMPT